ncbi:MAG: sarcosine oxidase subunit gamma [Chloroflexi bacterium]|nr:sarcosine oxidase subunit gamma [Chloroflexota bacterium]
MVEQRFADGGAVSPLGNRTFDPVVVVAGPGVEVLEHSFTDQLDVRLDPEPAVLGALGDRLRVAIPAEPNRVGRDGRRLALWLAPDEWLVLDPDNLEDDVARLTMEGGWPPDVTFVDVSAHRTLLELRGRDARALLARGCPLDLDPRVFGPDHCAQTLLARVDVILFRLDGTDAFGVLVRASFARYLVAWLTDALEGFYA